MSIATVHETKLIDFTLDKIFQYIAADCNIDEITMKALLDSSSRIRALVSVNYRMEKQKLLNDKLSLTFSKIVWNTYVMSSIDIKGTLGAQLNRKL